MTETMTSALVGAVIGGLIGIIGTLIGGKYSYKAAMDSVTKQIQHDIEMLQNEKAKSEADSASIILLLLSNEMRYNIEFLTPFRKYFDNEKELASTTVLFDSSKLKFDDYNQVKFELVKQSNFIVKDTVEHYNALYLLQKYTKINDMNKETKSTIVDMFKKWDNLSKIVSNYKESR